MENFELQQYPSELAPFFNLKSGGKQVDQLIPTIIPTIDVREMSYPVFSNLPPRLQLTAAGSVSFNFQSGPGLYRVRGVATLTGVNGLTAGKIYLTLAGVLMNYEIIGLFAAASTPFNESAMIDFLMDIRGGVETGYGQFELSAPAGITTVDGRASITVQRIL